MMSKVYAILFVLGAPLLMATGTGCKAISAVTGTARAAADPKNAWALNDPGPMSVVVRRADAAEQTSSEVDRLLTRTPAQKDATWLATAAPTQERAQKEIEELAAHKLYQDSMARVVEAEVWAHTLKSVGDASPPAASSVPTSTTTVSAATVPDSKPTKPKQGKTRRRGTLAVAVDAKTAKPAADAPKKAAAPSLLGEIDPALDAAYAKVLERERHVADLKAALAVKEAAADEKGIAETEKTARKEAVTAIEKQIAVEEAEIPRMRTELVGAVRLASSKAPVETRDRLGGACVALRQAVTDAENANGAAALKYALAAQTLPDSTRAMAFVYLDDIIEEKTGKRMRPDQGITPGVSLDGSKVNVTVNGLDKSDFAKLDARDVGKETTARTQRWVTHAVTLVGSIAANREILMFEHSVLDALIGGFESSGWTAPAAPKIPQHDPKKTAKR